MKLEQFNFKSHDMINNIHGKIYIPQANIKGIIQIVHGMCEYGNRYDEFSKFLALNGFVVVVHDNLGHGTSVKNLNDLGYYFNVDGSTDILEPDRSGYRQENHFIPRRQELKEKNRITKEIIKIN